MDRRTRLLLVIVLGLILLGIGIWIFLQPILQSAAPAAQPPALPTNITPTEQPFTPPVHQSTTTAPTATAPTPQSGLLALENQAASDAASMGTGTSENGFQGYADLYTSATANGKAALQAAAQAMQTAHPPTGPLYGITTVAPTPRILSGNYGDASLTVTMDVLESVDNGNPANASKPTQHLVTITFVKQADGSYLLDSFTWQ